ncbi:acyl dehydratase [Jannaschia sp. W003]|uniref:acyl dehydratase n=1 Tax=Jannaschia sp. W003 TaxID=2867012 RepID=UPI0021A3A6F9|nr:acyl dehydratase [Jannaschia sp. W003]UWQ21276.1 acyl dehydratase [Jannaschia sp. W003]
MDASAPHVVEDRMDPARAAAMAATLGRPAPGAALPRFWHHAHFWEAHPPEALGRDGHPRPGIAPIPETGFPRRMWAGGALRWFAPLRTGEPAEKATRVLSLERKAGRTGPFALLRLEHWITQGGRLCVEERQDLVYRPDPAPGDATPPPPEAPEGEVLGAVPTDPVTLLRFSALTFNGHRIHYDAAYAREVEGHGGVVVHGPLLAEALIHAAGDVAAFRYRATAPLLAGERGEVMRDRARFWIRGPDGRLCMEGEAT